MKKREAKIKALWKLWHWGFHVYEGYPEKLSDTFNDDVDMGRLTEAEARKVQKTLFEECQKIRKRIDRLQRAVGQTGA